MRHPIILAILVMGLAGCAVRTEYRSVYPEQNPAGGVAQAYEICRAKSRAASGYDWIDAMSRRGSALDACMLEYGYRLQRVQDN